MARRLAISNKVRFPVTLSIDDDHGSKTIYRCDLFADRLSVTELRGLEIGRDDKAVEDFLCRVCTGWAGQTLVLEDDGTPAAFSADALRDMLGVPGAIGIVSARYLAAITAKEKN